MRVVILGVLCLHISINAVIRAYPNSTGQSEEDRENLAVNQLNSLTGFGSLDLSSPTASDQNSKSQANGDFLSSLLKNSTQSTPVPNLKLPTLQTNFSVPNDRGQSNPLLSSFGSALAASKLQAANSNATTNGSDSTTYGSDASGQYDAYGANAESVTATVSTTCKCK